MSANLNKLPKTFFKRHKLKIQILSVFLLFFLAMFGPFLWFLGSTVLERWEERAARIPFDQVKWQDQSLVHNAKPIRIRMIDDLLKTHDFHDKSRMEVVNLLGEPDKTEFFRDWGMVYWLGPERRWISIDSEWLVIRLNEKKEVTEYRLVTD